MYHNLVVVRPSLWCSCRRNTVSRLAKYTLLNIDGTVFVSPFDALGSRPLQFRKKLGFCPNWPEPPPPFLPPRGGMGIKLFWAIYLFFKKCYHFILEISTRYQLFPINALGSFSTISCWLIISHFLQTSQGAWQKYFRYIDPHITLNANQCSKGRRLLSAYK